MEDRFIPYELALKLKKLGFNEDCFALYNPILHLDFYSKNSNIDLYTDNKMVVCSAIIWDDAFEWFRRKFNMDGEVGCRYDMRYDETNQRCMNRFYSFNVFRMYKHDSFQYSEIKYYPSYIEAQIECLKKLIELTKEFK